LSAVDETPDELRRMMESLLTYATVMDARFEATQAQYAALMTNMEVIKQHMQNNHEILKRIAKTKTSLLDAIEALLEDRQQRNNERES
jgi:hypothetical protein